MKLLIARWQRRPWMPTTRRALTYTRRRQQRPMLLPARGGERRVGAPMLTCGTLVPQHGAIMMAACVPDSALRLDPSVSRSRNYGQQHQVAQGHLHAPGKGYLQAPAPHRHGCPSDSPALRHDQMCRAPILPRPHPEAGGLAEGAPM